MTKNVYNTEVINTLQEVENMRAFIAFPTSPEVKDELLRFEAELYRLNPKMPVKWSEDYNMHVTVDFLGEINGEILRQTKGILREIASHSRPFEYHIEKFDAFPSLNNPRVLMVEMEESGWNSVGLHDELHKAILDKTRLDLDNKPWRPHVTLGRLKADWERGVVQDGLSIKPLSWIVDYVELIKSDLTPAGSKYTVLEKFFLTGSLR